MFNHPRRKPRVHQQSLLSSAHFPTRPSLGQPPSVYLLSLLDTAPFHLHQQYMSADFPTSLPVHDVWVSDYSHSFVGGKWYLLVVLIWVSLHPFIPYTALRSNVQVTSFPRVHVPPFLSLPPSAFLLAQGRGFSAEFSGPLWAELQPLTLGALSQQKSAYSQWSLKKKYWSASLSFQKENGTVRKTSLAVQWLKLHAHNAGGLGGQGSLVRELDSMCSD